MNVTELARRLRLPVDVTRHLIRKLGFDVGLKAIKVDATIAQQIIEKVKQSPQAIEEVKIELGYITKRVIAPTPTEPTTKRILELPELITVRELAELLHKPVTDVVAELMKNGIFANVNEDIDFETATIIAEDLGFTAQKIQRDESTKQTDTKSIKDLLGEDSAKSSRPPVVVIMGHVDHGKTTLLDAIRKTHVVDTEAGKITQHIGAYQIMWNKKPITFIDTPGHEAFTAMRSRGANVADIAIVVMAWDEGFKPQTEEAFNIVKKTDLPFIVAVTKMDKTGSSLDKALQQLAEKNYVPEKWGGDVIVTPVAAQTGKGLDELLNLILLRAEMEGEKITADPMRPGVGTIIESHIDKGEGPVATVIVQTGTLRTGDLVIAGNAAGKIRSLKNDLGETIPEALPSAPVRILGLTQLPNVGDILQVTEDKKALKKMLKTQKVRSDQLRERRYKISRQAGKQKTDSTLHILLKTDNAGTQEAITESIEKLPQDEVKIRFIKKGIGPLTESDIADAKSGEAIIYTFNLDTPSHIKEAISLEKADVRPFTIIYKLIEDIIAEAEGRLAPEKISTLIGTLRVSAIFREKNNAQIVGGTVQEGLIQPQAAADVIRKKDIIGMGKITEVRLGPRKVDNAQSGSECGIRIEGVPKIEPGDLIKIYSVTERKKTLIVS